MKLDIPNGKRFNEFPELLEIKDTNDILLIRSADGTGVKHLKISALLKKALSGLGEWAQQPQKPTYTAEEVGAQPAGNYVERTELTPKIYQVYGELLNGTNDPIKGIGSATVAITGKHARIDFVIRISASGKLDKNVYWGISPNALRAGNGNIPKITPMPGGTLVVYAGEPRSIDLTLSGFGGAFEHIGGSNDTHYWLPARVYTDGGAVGGWESASFKTGMYLIGHCIGIVEG